MTRHRRAPGRAAAYARRAGRRPPVLRQNSVRRQVIDLAGLIQRKFRLDGPPPAPPASTASPPLRRSPPCRLGESGPTPPARRLQEDADPAEGAQERPTLLGRAVEGVGRLEGARKWRRIRTFHQLIQSQRRNPLCD